MDPLERLMAKFDITGQQGPAATLRGPASSSAAGSVPSVPDCPPSPTPSTASDARVANGIRTQGSRRRLPTHNQQLKHALTINAAHVITHDYLTLSQPLSEGLLLMDCTDRKLKLIHSLGALQPLHNYTTEYGNSLIRHAKHKALLAGSIEVDVPTDEIDFDAQLERVARERDAAGSVKLSHKQAAYRAFASCEAEASSEGDGSSEAKSGTLAESVLAGEKLEEAEALDRLQHLASRLTEMEAWFDSVKAEAASERKIREQATARLQVMQERLERLQNQVRAQADENKLLRNRLFELRDSQPELHRRHPSTDRS